MKSHATLIGCSFWTPKITSIGSAIKSFDQIMKRLFANNEQGAYFDPNDLTDEKMNWRKNLLTETEFRNGLGDTTVRGGDVTATPFNGLSGTGLQLARTNVSSYAYKGAPVTRGVTYTFSFFIEMPDSSPPVFTQSSANPTADVAFLIGGSLITPTVVHVYGNVYRASAVYTYTSTGNSVYVGVIKYSGYTERSFKISGFQFEVGDVATMYQPITDFNTEFLKAFPMHTLFENAYRGDVPVVSPSQPLGLVLDKSKGLKHVNLNVDNFNNAAYWTTSVGDVVVANGKATFSGSTAYLSSSNKLIIGKWYKATLTVKRASGSYLMPYDGAGVNNTVGITSSGTYTRIFQAINSTLFAGYSNNFVGEISEIKIEEIQGNHSAQTTSSMRPLLGRMPEGGARNLIPYSGTGTNAIWVFNGGLKEGGQLDSRGTNKATRFSGASTTPAYIAGLGVLKGGAYTYTVTLKSGSSAQTSANLLLRNNTTGVNYNGGSINFLTGAILGAGWSVKAKANGFFECTYTQATGINAGDSINMYYGVTGVAPSTFNVIVDCIQFEEGRVSTAYQDTQSLLDITEEGKPSVCYFAPDGTDDFFITNSIDFTATDKMSVFAGVRKLSDASVQMIAELSSGNQNTNMFSLLRGAGSTEYVQSFLRASASGAYCTVNNAAYAAPTSLVVAAKYDISGSSKQVMQINSKVAATSLINVGTGKFGNYPLYIGRRGGASLPFNGHIYGLILLSRLATDAETAAIEKEFAKRMGVTLSV